MKALWILAGLCGLLVVLGVVEALIHRRNLRWVPVRVHVNGTRGKSSVTRLIAAGLREAGVRTCAKTTGTLARMILPDGREYPVFRLAKPNVLEQIRIVAAAASCRAEALVIECMALQPHLQWISEGQLVRATHGVITNARADHLDVMGPEPVDVAKALAGTIPRKGSLFTAELRHLSVFEEACADRGTRLVLVGDRDAAALSTDDMRRFRHVEHKENVALALAVCAALGVARDVALAGMWKAAPDPGAMSEHEVHFFGRRIVFVNGFAANDPESSERIWNMALERHPDVCTRVAVFNCREDRPDRTRELARAYVRWRQPDHLVLMGSGTYLFLREAARSAGPDGLPRTSMAEDRRVDEIFEILVNLAGPSALVMGLGNIGGQGLEVVQYFRNRSVLQEQS